MSLQAPQRDDPYRCNTSRKRSIRASFFFLSILARFSSRHRTAGSASAPSTPSSFHSGSPSSKTPGLFVILRHFADDFANQLLAGADKVVHRHACIGHAVEAARKFLRDVHARGREEFGERTI